MPQGAKSTAGCNSLDAPDLTRADREQILPASTLPDEQPVTHEKLFRPIRRVFPAVARGFRR